MHTKSVSLDTPGTVISVRGALFKKQFTVKYGFRHGASGLLSPFPRVWWEK